MYDKGRPSSPWWLEAFVLTRAVFGILFWPLVAIVAVMAIIGGLIAAFSAGAVWGFLALGLIAAGIGAFAWWDRRRPPRI